jgi:PilZ domain
MRRPKYPYLNQLGRSDNSMAKAKAHQSQSYPQKREYRRFCLRHQVILKYHTGDSVSELQAVSKNVSIGGLLLETDSLIPQCCPVSFVVTVNRGPVIRPIQFIGEGEVVRVEPDATGAGFAIAVKCKHPLSQLEHCLS